MLRDNLSGLRRLLFRRRKRHPSEPFEFGPIDVEAVKRELRLRRKALERGAAGLPGAAEKEWDSPQQDVIAHLHTRVSDGYREANERLAFLWSVVDRRDVGAVTRQLEELPTRLHQEATEELQGLRRELERAQNRQRTAEQHIARARERYGLERGPEIKEGFERWRLLALTLGVAAIQGAFNAAIFAQGLEFGIAQGVLVATLVGLFDVFAHTFLGYGARVARGPGGPRRWLGVLLTLAAAVTIPSWNLAMVHYRMALERLGFGEGNTAWVDTFISAPLGFSDFWLVMLLGVGLFCSILAFITGFYWDEPVREYLKYGKELRRARDESDLLEDEIAQIEREYGEHFSAERDDLLQQIEQNFQMAERTFREIRTVHENLDTQIADAQQAGHAAIRFYRDENRQARGNDGPPPPKYFDDPIEFEISKALELKYNLGDMEGRIEKQRELMRSATASPPKPVPLQKDMEARA